MDEENLALLSMSPERSLVVTFPRANAKRTAASHVLTARSIYGVLEKSISLCDNRAIESREFRAGDMH